MPLVGVADRDARGGELRGPSGFRTATATLSAGTQCSRLSTTSRPSSPVAAEITITLGSWGV
jgi:hypothetical protein